MVAVPRVKTFLGCIDLRIACLVIAAIRFVTSIILIVGLLILLVHKFYPEPSNVNTSNYDDEDGEIPYGLLALFILIFGVVTVPLVANVIVTYWFIRGLLSYNPQKMKCYLWLEIIYIFLLLLGGAYFLHVSFLTGAVVECYIYICSNSLYQDYIEKADNATEDTAMTSRRNQGSDY